MNYVGPSTTIMLIQKPTTVYITTLTHRRPQRNNVRQKPQPASSSFVYRKWLAQEHALIRTTSIEDRGIIQSATLMWMCAASVCYSWAFSDLLTLFNAVEKPPLMPGIFV